MKKSNAALKLPIWYEKFQEKWPQVEVLHSSELETKVDYSKQILIAEDWSPKSILESHMQHSGLHYVSSDLACFEKNADFAALALDQNIFSRAEEHFAAKAVKKHNISFSLRDVKSNILTQVENLLRNQQGHSNLLPDLLCIADELLMNVFYSASKKPSSSDKVKEHQFFVLEDNEDIVIGTRDRFGSLDLQKVAQRMNTVFQDGFGQSIRFQGGGAGIGLSLVFEKSQSLVLGVEPGKESLIFAALPLRKSRKRAQLQTKNLHIITRGGNHVLKD